MDAHPPDEARQDLIARAQLLSRLSVAWGLVAGSWGLASGILAGSLGVVGLGLTVLADITGSLALVWRFGVERREPHRRRHAEARASLIVATALGIVACTLTVTAVAALIARSAAEPSTVAMLAAGISAVVLAPLGVLKRATGAAMHSHALRGDGTLSIVGATLGVIAVLALIAQRTAHLWWADRVAALLVATIAFAEAARVLRRRPR